MSKTRNLCAQIPEELHAKVREEQERLGKTLSEYVGEILEQYFEQQKGGKTMSGNSRTLAFQVSEELFERLKAYLTANKLKQKEFVVCGTLWCVRAGDDEAVGTAAGSP